MKLRITGTAVALFILMWLTMGTVILLPVLVITDCFGLSNKVLAVSAIAGYAVPFMYLIIRTVVQIVKDSRKK